MKYTEAFDCVDNHKLWKILKRWEYQTILPVFWEPVYKKQQLYPNMNQWIGSKLGEEYIKAVYCHLVI